MKHFHGTPISGTKIAQTQVLRGRFAFVPWKAPRTLEIAMAVSRGFAVDNSAFSFWRTGEKPHWPDYIAWVKGFCRHPRFEFAVIPDVIDGTEADNDELIKQWDKACWHPMRVHGCPVWHLHESMERLERLVNGRYDIVALGSSGQYATPGVGDWWNRMDEAFEVICEDGQPRCRVHGLRMLSPKIVRRYPFYSCDSTNVAQNGWREARKHGFDNAAWGAEQIASRIEQTQSLNPYKTARVEVQQGLFGIES